MSSQDDRVILRNVDCGLCAQLRRDYEKAIDETDRIFASLARERRHHIEAAEDARRHEAQVDRLWED